VRPVSASKTRTHTASQREAGYLPSISVAADADPLFILGRVQFDIHIPANLVAFAIASDLLYMGLANNQIVHINLKKPELAQWIQVKVPIYKLFLDPSGRHLLIASQSGEAYYLYAGWQQRQPKLLQSFKLVIESVAWNRTYLLSTAASKAGASSTRELLLGGRNGTIYEAILDGKDEIFKNHDRVLRPLFTLPERQPIAGIQFEWFPVSDPKQGLVIVGTTTRLYQFAGAPNKQTDDGVRTFASIFNTYKDTTPSKAPIPSDRIIDCLQSSLN
jgi:vacuolar protein sorting-associated protein 18